MRRRWQLVWLGMLVSGMVGCSGSSGSSSTAQAPSTPASSSPASSTPSTGTPASNPAPTTPAGMSGPGAPGAAPMGPATGAPGAAAPGAAPAPGGSGYGLPGSPTTGPSTGAPPGGAGYGLPGSPTTGPATGGPAPGAAGYGLGGATTGAPTTGGPAPGQAGYGLPPPNTSGSAAPTTTGAIPGGASNGLIPGGTPMTAGASVGSLPSTGPGTAGAAGATATIPGGVPGGPGYGLPGTGAAGAGIGGTLGNPYGQQALPEPKTLMEFAQRAFKEGNDKEGFDYLAAHYLCNDDGIKEAVKWSDELRRPTIGVRFGFGVAYVPGRDFTGDPQPIGRVVAVKKEKKEGNGNPGAPTTSGPPAGMSGMGMMGGNNNAAPDGSDGFKALDWYTGDLGKKLFEELKTQIEAGEYGAALKGLDGPNSKLPEANNNSGGSMPLGMPAGMPAGMGMPGTGGAANTAAKGEPRGMVPGVTWIGQMSTREAVEKKAREQGIDVLFLFEVNVTAGKNGVVRNTTKVRVSALERSKDIIVSPLLANHKLNDDREKQKDKDPVEAEVTKIMEAVQKSVKVTDLPEAITADKATARIKKLAGSPENGLRTLLEAKLYLTLGLLKPEELQETVAALGGSGLEKLVTGTNEAEKAEALKDLLPKKKKA
ncbi:MAG: hypothetical protein ACO1RA_10465 [Planctomycetaceae bacterium]